MIRQLVVTSDRLLVTASDDKTVRICDPDALCEKRKLLGQIGPGWGKIYALALTADGKHLPPEGSFPTNPLTAAPSASTISTPGRCFSCLQAMKT